MSTDTLEDDTGTETAEGIDKELQQELESLRNLQLDLRDIAEAERTVAELDRRIEGIKADLKDAKDEHDGAVSNLRRLVRSAGKSMPLFNKTKPAASETNSASGETKAADSPIEDESWRTVPLSTLDIPPGTLKLLEENQGCPITTVGELAEWTKTRPLSDIKGIGSGKATKIEDALENFWGDRLINQEPEDDADDESIVLEDAEAQDDVSDNDSSSNCGEAIDEDDVEDEVDQPGDDQPVVDEDDQESDDIEDGDDEDDFDSEFDEL